MTDIRISLEGGLADVEILGGDLRADQSLRTAVLISLFTDGRAALEAVLPDYTGDRRGWWAQSLLTSDAQGFGSLLWTLERAKLTTETLTLAEGYARDALTWLVDDGIAEAVEALATRFGTDRMLLAVELVRGNATAFPAEWAAFEAISVDPGPLSVKVVTR